MIEKWAVIKHNKRIKELMHYGKFYNKRRG